MKLMLHVNFVRAVTVNFVKASQWIESQPTNLAMP